MIGYLIASKTADLACALVSVLASLHACTLVFACVNTLHLSHTNAYQLWYNAHLVIVIVDWPRRCM